MILFLSILYLGFDDESQKPGVYWWTKIDKDFVKKWAPKYIYSNKIKYSEILKLAQEDNKNSNSLKESWKNRSL